MALTAPPDRHVPFLDLSVSNARVKAEIVADLAAMIDSSTFSNGPQIAQFEDAFASYCGTAHCVGVASGLDALRLGLLAAGCAPGDEVIVPANTFIATFEAVTQARGVPVPVDVAPDDYNLDVDRIEAALTPRTRFLLPVHLYGQLADMRQLRALADAHPLTIVEDACQAHGASREGIRAGAGGHAAAFSFYPGKNLGAMGDAGALVTDDEELAAVVRALREHGQRTKYVHDFEGYTARLDTAQAIVLGHKLPHLDAWNADRRHVADAYTAALAGVGDLRLPSVATDSTPVWHLYVVGTADPTGLGDFLRARHIATGRHYPQPAHLSPAYAWLGHAAGAFPVTEALAGDCLSLPVFPGMTEAQVESVISAVCDFFEPNRD